jgi:hypothetical protein
VHVHGQLALDDVTGGVRRAIGAVGADHVDAGDVVGGSVGGDVAGTGSGATGADVDVVVASSVAGAAGTAGVLTAGTAGVLTAGRAVAVDVVADCVAMPIPSTDAATTLAAPTNARAPAAGRRRAVRARRWGGGLRFMPPSVRLGGSTNSHGTVRVVEERCGARKDGPERRSGIAPGAEPARETAQP